MARRYWLIRFSAYRRVVAITVIVWAKMPYHFCKLLEIVNIVLEPVDHAIVVQLFACIHHSVTRHLGPFISIRKGMFKEDVSDDLQDGPTENRLDTRVLP
jgi:hypothetical protein